VNSRQHASTARQTVSHRCVSKAIAFS